jgi:AcrR family transcriptional regulator
MSGTATASSDREDGRRRRHPPHVRRALILEAARACIEERGLSHTTARVIARASGVSTGTITYYFSSVDEILLDVLRATSEEFTDAFVEQAQRRENAAEKLLYVIENNVPDHPEARRVWRLWLDYWALAVHRPELAVLHRERYRVYRGAIRRIVEDGVASGEFRCVDAGQVATEFVALFDGLGLEVAIGDEEVDAGRARELLRAFVESRLLPASEVADEPDHVPR